MKIITISRESLDSTNTPIDKDNEDTRRNCNWCGYQLIDEQVDPDLCGACYAQYLKELNQ